MASEPIITALDVPEVQVGHSIWFGALPDFEHGAQLLGLSDLGTIEVGKEGDLIAVEGSPPADIHVLQNVRVVIYHGKNLVPANRSSALPKQSF